ncbi:MAG: Hpt domain-containing protein [Candidatus Accumulibacter sp.]|jgi:chemosensory pili system protein ChpA (sensor histidine kinase/response regulator)|nr:Hpt domain-containing protein [Accumulibacter sp.]
MNATVEFDAGPLTWVVGEIDLALKRAVSALDQYGDNAPDSTRLRFCRTHLHQVRGALTIVGLDGVTQFVEALEGLLETIEAQACPADDASLALARNALEAVGAYLREVADGQADQPLRLLPLYRKIQSARGVRRHSAADLFFPDLSVRPPHRRRLSRTLSEAERFTLLRRERARFQRGLLAWLHAPEDGNGVREMRTAARRIEETQETEAARAFWWVAGGFLGALATGDARNTADAKSLCARIDLQIRRLLEGSRNVAERLMRDALYLVAESASNDATVRQIRETYRLDALFPADAATVAAIPDAARTAMGRLREVVPVVEDAWDKFCAGNVASLPVFRENLDVLSELVAQTGHTDFRRLAQAIVAVAQWLAESPARHSNALAMEVATALLLVWSAWKNYPRPGPNFAHQVDVTVERIHACIAGHPPTSGPDPALLDEISRRAQETLLVGQVAREIRNNLHQIEQGLDGFFRDAEKRPELAGLEKPFQQIIGALSMLRLDGAAAEAQDCLDAVRRFAAPDGASSGDEFETLASRLSMLGFFVEAMPRGATDFGDFVRKTRAPTCEAGEAAKGGDVSVEREIEQSRREARALLDALREQSEDTGLREALRRNLETLKRDADLVADAKLGEQVGAMLEILASGVEVVPRIDRLLAAQSPDTPATPSRESLRIPPASREETDAELLGIFLEEAREVMTAVEANLRQLKRDRRDHAALTTLRRSFHTLKGSGRMVGIEDLGEAAWAVERTLNLWLRLDLPVDAELTGLLDEAYGVFSAWVRHLETPTDSAPDPQGMMARAAALRAGVDADPISVELTPASPEEAADVSIGSPDVREERIELGPPAEEAAEEAVGSDGKSDAGEASEASSSRVGVSPALFAVFSEEARTHLRVLRCGLPTLESEEASATPPDMYRAAHTFASISATVGLHPISRLGRALERALLRRDRSRQAGSVLALDTIHRTVGELESMFSVALERRELDVPPGLIEELDGLYPVADVPADAAGADEIAVMDDPGGAIPDSPVVPPEMLATARKMPATPPATVSARDEIDAQLLPVFLEEAVELSRDIAGQIRAWRAGGDDGDAARRVLARQLHTLKGSARMAGAMTLGEITHALETRVDQAGRVDAVPADVIDGIESDFESIRQIIERLQRGETTGAVPDAVSAVVPEGELADADEGDAALSQAMLRVRAEAVDRLVNGAGELSIARSRIEDELRGMKEPLLDLTENVLRLRRQLREIGIQAESRIQSRDVTVGDGMHVGFDPLEFDRFTRFQELTRMMAESVNDVATAQQQLLVNLDAANVAIVAQARQNREVQQELMAMRMVPFDSLTDRLYRVLRQASKDFDKRACLEIRGGQVELDRGVLDRIAAPLEHMLRNAVAHGIEGRAERIARGKPEAGEILLSLAQEGNEIVLLLSDDGAGFDYARIRERAVAAGLLGEDEVADEAHLAEFIFAPGFSTARALSEAAGRGIGMDVVRTGIADLGGRIEIESRPGRGSVFRMILPLTLVVTKALLVRAGDRTFAIPASMIEQVLDLREAELARIREAGHVERQSLRYPLSYLPRLLGDSAVLPEARWRYRILLVRGGSRRIALQVDELCGNQEIVVKNIGAQLARVVGVNGATVLGDGQVVLILNPVALFARAGGAPCVVESADRPAPVVLPTVMVVDDSLTVRKVTGALMAREGYRVILARDGVEALEKLLDVVPDVMLIDIEMPRMDGFDLTRNIRADARLRHIPIIMITSRTAEKHRNYAREVGVDHYLGKPYREEELLRLVAGYGKRRQIAD